MQHLNNYSSKIDIQNSLSNESWGNERDLFRPTAMNMIAWRWNCETNTKAVKNWKPTRVLICRSIFNIFNKNSLLHLTTHFFDGGGAHYRRRLSSSRGFELPLSSVAVMVEGLRCSRVLSRWKKVESKISFTETSSYLFELLEGWPEAGASARRSLENRLRHQQCIQPKQESYNLLAIMAHLNQRTWIKSPSGE